MCLTIPHSHNRLLCDKFIDDNNKSAEKISEVVMQLGNNFPVYPALLTINVALSQVNKWLGRPISIPIVLNDFFEVTNEPFKHFQAALPEVGSATSKPTILPISRGDMLPPTDNAFTSLGTNAFPSSRYRS